MAEPAGAEHGVHEIRDGLIDAMLAVTTGLDLEQTLTTIVDTAMRLVDARYGALGVLDRSETALERFIHQGIDEQAAALIGPLPQGRGVLGYCWPNPNRSGSPMCPSIRPRSASRRTIRRCAPSSASPSASATGSTATSTSPRRPTGNCSAPTTSW